MKKKWFLYLTGFFCGMSVMAIEIGAQRLLAPYFSSSQIVWTIVIGVIMISMAIGNVLGGKMADKHKDPKRLFIFLFLAAIWTALIPLVGKFVISGIALLLALFVTNGYLIWAATISCLVVFVFPLLILGMVTPNLVKFTVTDEKESGKTVGVIEALNTIGSILGTFLPTFGFIPFIGTALTFIIFASILFIICLIFVILTLIQKKKDMNGIKPSEEDKKQDIKKIVKTTCLSLAALSSLSSGFVSRKISSAYWQNNVIYESESIYNYIRVEETSSSIILSTNVLFGVQSIMMKDPEDFSGMYFEYALTSPYLVDKDEPLDICILGLCTGTFASKCYQFFPNCNIDGVEIDGKIVDVAYKYFNLSSKVNVYINDGRSFIDHTDKKYDVIMVDAYKDVTIPFQMSSDEFFKSCASHLKEGGNMVCNFNMASSKKDSINDYLASTITRSFNNVYLALLPGSTNSILLASNSYDIKERLSSVIANYPSTSNKKVLNVLNYVNSHAEKYEYKGYYLTDDKAPVELLGVKVLDELINNELSYYHELIKGKSLKELFEMLLNGELF